MIRFFFRTDSRRLSAAMCMAISLFLCPSLAQADESLVLVTARESQFDEISAKEVRRLYLGARIHRAQKQLEPVLNNTDEHMTEMFMQKVMFISDAVYQRTILAAVIRGRMTRPKTFEAHEALVKAILAKPGCVTYMWASQAEQDSRLKVVARLW